MALKSEREASYGHEKLYREQIVTTYDLNHFKEVLLKDLTKIIAENYSSNPKKWLKSFEVRELLGISPGTLQNFRVKGDLPYTRVGGMLFYEYADIQKMLKSNKISTPDRFK
ncbi:helix-turn-helix domain-containing protein [Carboxylicivirga sp. N1Y90]|uniref:helix-turn-helix domain-containing protein n=1 Tax=Carboxylicivirga fragile TaxID=3417571 RepID=UPI003D356E82|nr:helix-turn-helix domain-containing protein [Marinilabiliaceae bacterium N1Y90]